jgi:hypothetical protein
LVLILAECAVERHGQRRLIAAEETRSRSGRQNAEMPAGSDGTRKSLAPASGAGGGAHNGDVPVGAHIVPVCAEDSMRMDGAGSGKWVTGSAIPAGGRHRKFLRTPFVLLAIQSLKCIPLRDSEDTWGRPALAGRI